MAATILAAAGCGGSDEEPVSANAAADEAEADGPMNAAEKKLCGIAEKDDDSDNSVGLIIARAVGGDVGDEGAAQIRAVAAQMATLVEESRAKIAKPANEFLGASQSFKGSHVAGPDVDDMKNGLAGLLLACVTASMPQGGMLPPAAVPAAGGQ